MKKKIASVCVVLAIAISAHATEPAPLIDPYKPSLLELFIAWWHEANGDYNY